MGTVQIPSEHCSGHVPSLGLWFSVAFCELLSRVQQCTSGARQIHAPSWYVFPHRYESRYLSYIFPSLKYTFPALNIFSEGGRVVRNRYYSVWEEVHKLVELLEKTRRQERKSFYTPDVEDEEDGSGEGSDSD